MSFSRHRILLALGLAALALSACSGRNLNSDLKDEPDTLVRQWTLQTRTGFEAGERGFEYSNPVLWENTLLFGSQSQGVTSMYPSLQLRRWTLPIPGGVTSEITVERGQAYFVGADGYLYCVSAESGRVAWRYDLHNPVASQPTIDGGRVFVTTSDDTIFALDAGTGKWLWHFRRRSAAMATIRGASKPLVLGNEVVAGLSDGFLVSVDVNDGQLKWERKLSTNAKFMDVDADPVVDDAHFYVPSYDGALYALKRQGGGVVWRFDAGGSKRVTLDGAKLYFPSNEGSVYAVQKSSGKVLWKFELDGGSPTQLVVTDRYVIVGSSFQYLYALDKETGRGVYRFDSGWGSGFSGAPLYDPASARLYFLSGAGNLYSFAVLPPPRVRPRGSVSPYRF